MKCHRWIFDLPCEHENFKAVVDVTRLLKEEGDIAPTGYMADVKISCADCGQRFRFIGLPMGLNLNGPAMSADGMEARLAILPNPTND